LEEKVEDSEHSQGLRAAQEERSRLLSLTHHAGWKWYQDILEVQVTARRNHFELVPLQKMDEVLAEQFLKGEISALRLAQTIINARVEELESEIEEHEKVLGI
jgi:hypothetical protein